MKKSLMLRGAVALLSRAICHVGKGEKWGYDSYLDPAIEQADNILTFALWRVERLFEKENA